MMLVVTSSSAATSHTAVAPTTGMSFRQGNEKFNGEEIVLHGQQLGGAEGRRSRTVTRLEDNGNTILHRQYGVAPDGAERLVMELRLTRRDKAAK